MLCVIRMRRFLCVMVYLVRKPAALAVILQTVGVLDQTSGIYNALMVPYKVSMGFISVYVAFTIAYSYAKSLKMQALMCIDRQRNQ